jgi:hypothetical protein
LRCLESTPHVTLLTTTLPCRFCVALALPPQREVSLKNGCLGSTKPVECAAVYNGAMTHGLHGALQVYSNLAMEVLDVVDSLDFEVCGVDVTPTRRCGDDVIVATVSDVQSAFASRDWQSLDELTVHIFEALDHMTVLRDDGVSQRVHRFSSLITYLTVSRARTSHACLHSLFASWCAGGACHLLPPAAVRHPLPLNHNVLACRVVSCRVVSCRVVSCRVVSCRVVSCRVVSCRVVSCRVVYALQVTVALFTVAINIVVFHPMLQRLDSEVKGTRSLLLLMPHDLVTAVPALHAATLQLAARRR